MNSVNGNGMEAMANEEVDLLYENDIQSSQTPSLSQCKSSLLFYTTIIGETEFTPFSILWILFQLGNLLLLILFLIPNSKRVIWRVLAIIYSLILLSLAYFTQESYDLVVWSSIFCCVNLIYVIVGVLRCKGHFSSDNEQVYKKLFAPLRVSRSQFSQILSCKRNTIILHTGENYATEKITRVDSLSLVVSGRLLVSQQGRPLHIILQHQFVDSPEYFGVSTDELFQVTITAVEESKLLIWHRDKLRLTIMSDEFLRVMFDHIIGRDVVRKLIQVSDTVSAPQVNGGFNNSPPPPIKHDSTTAEECDPMLTNTSKDLAAVPFDSSLRVKIFV